MGRRKSKSNPAKVALDTDRSRAPQRDFDGLGSPFALAALEAAAGGEANTSEGRAYMQPEAFLESGMHTGQPVLVASTSCKQEGREQGLLSPGALAKASLETPYPSNIWDSLRIQQKVCLDQEDQCIEDPVLADAFKRLAISPDAAKQSSISASEITDSTRQDMAQGVEESGDVAHSLDTRQPGNELGEFFLPATLWPAKVSKGCVQLSAGLLNSSGGSTNLGSLALMYKGLTSKRTIILHLQQLWHRLQDGASLDVTSTTWLERILGEKNSGAYGLLQRSSLWHLRGRLVMHGNPIMLPILGCERVFRVETHDKDRKPWQCVQINENTLIHLLLPRERHSCTTESKSEGDVFAQEAAKSAAEAVGGGREGPAAQAAFRAAQAGVMALKGQELSKLGGLASQMEALEKLVLLPMQNPGVYQRYGIQPPRGMLLWGPPGTGKTRLAAAMSAKAGLPFYVVNGPDIVSAYYGHSEAGLRGVFAAARAVAPAIIFFDEVDSIAAARQGGSASWGSGSSDTSSASGASVRLVTTLLTEMAAPESSGVCVIAATNRPGSLDPALRRPGRFDRELELGVPSPADRMDILRVHLDGIKHCLSGAQIAELGRLAHGFVGADLLLLVKEASFKAVCRCHKAQLAKPDEIWVEMQDFAEARREVSPSAMREIALEAPNVRWKDVGGLEDVKERLKESLLWPQEKASDLARLGIRCPRGILLYGPPGCSKTLLARAVAAEAKLNFLAVKGPELFSKYVGDSEKAVARVFAKARSNSPSVVFFDEIDGLAVERSEGDDAAGMHNRVLATLLTELDGLQTRGEVVVLAATNRPDKLDTALLRAGRFDRLLYIPPPDAAAREAIFQVHTRNMPLSADVDLQGLAVTTSGYTGADITAVVREAGMAALQESLEARDICARHFSQALKAIPPSGILSNQLEELYKRFRRGIQAGQF